MTAKEFWKEKFKEYPQTDSDKLAVAMMQEYSNSCSPKKNELMEECRKNISPEIIKQVDKQFDDINLKYLKDINFWRRLELFMRGVGVNDLAEKKKNK